MSDYISLDDEITSVVDTFEDVSGYKILRANSNKLYLILKSIAAGFNKIRDVIISLKNRFNPQFCNEDDLENIMKITGISRIKSKPSSVQVMVNNDGSEDVSLSPGLYWFTSVEGIVFETKVNSYVSIKSNETSSMLFFSVDHGSYHLMNNSNIKVSTRSGAEIPDSISFRTLDNSLMLGNEEESLSDIRKRLLTGTDRQDTIKEMELSIKNLPTIYECNLIFNSKTEDVVVDDQTTIPPKTLLIIITGIPTEELAEIVASKSLYDTVKITNSQVVYYYNDLFIDGKFPVYYKKHSVFEYYIAISFTFNPNEISENKTKIELSNAFSHLKINVRQYERITEKELYSYLPDLVGVSVLKIYILEWDILAGEKKSVPVLNVPKLSIPRLKDIDFYVEDIS